MTTPIYAIGYARVSTTKQAVEGDSLENQAKIIAADIAANDWTIFPEAVLQEPFTGTTDDRRVYRHAVALIRQNREKIKYFVIRSMDRFSREGSRRYEEMKDELAALGVELRDTARVIQPKVNGLARFGFAYPWSLRSPSAVSEAALAQVHHEQRGAILEQLIGAEIALVQAGYHIGPSNDGYVARRIHVDGKKRFAQFPDPDRALFFQRMFGMRAEGTFSDGEIVRAVNAMGFRTRARNRWSPDGTKVIGRRAGKPLTVKQLQFIIKHPIYAGVICKRWTHDTPIRAQSGESLVSIDLYNRANRGARFIEERPDGSLSLLYHHHPTSLKAKRHKFRSVFPFKNIVACPICRKPLTASLSRGRSGQRFGAYHCSRNHPRYAVSQPVLEASFRTYLSELRPVGDTWERAEMVMRRVFLDAERELAVATERASVSIQALEERKDQLCDAFAAASSPGVRAELERRIDQVSIEIDDAKSEAASLGVSAAELDEFLSLAKEIVEHPSEILENTANIREQLALYGLFFERPPTHPEIVSGTADLTAVFRAFQPTHGEKSFPVHSVVLDWNTLAHVLKRWKDARWAIEAVLDRLRGTSGSSVGESVPKSPCPNTTGECADDDQIDEHDGLIAA